MEGIMLKLVRDERFSRAWFVNFTLVVLGSLIMGAAYVFFLVPHRITPGGVFGVAIILHHSLGLPVGLTGLVLNIPLLLWGVRELGPRFGVKTVLGMVLTSAAIDGMTALFGEQAASSDVLMSAAFGGVLLGAGLGMIFKAKATTGGSDIVASILARRTGAPVGQSLMLIDAFVVTAAVVIFRELSLGLYAVVALYTSARVIDAVMEGMNVQKTVLIVSSEVDAIRGVILDDLERGGTLLPGEGLYQGDPRPVIMTAVGRRELAILREQIRRIDPSAFVIVVDSREVLGLGFRPLAEEA
jgi:uncharacterized membrane-anchored protein YitT (DUF2179 family)